jgi:hypothetical protein
LFEVDEDPFPAVAVMVMVWLPVPPTVPPLIKNPMFPVVAVPRPPNMLVVAVIVGASIVPAETLTP